MSETSEFLRQNPVGHTEFLLERARAGSDTAWRELLRRYRTMLVFHVRTRIHGISRPDLEDLLQTVLSKAVAHIQGFRYQGEGSFRKWLARLVVNQCANELKLRAAQSAVHNDPRALAEVPDASAADQAELSAERQIVLEQLGELEEDDRDLLIMRYFEHLSWEAIAEVLGCSYEKAKSDYEQAFQRLARRLGA